MVSENVRVSKNIVGLGNPLLDISANVSQELLDKYNLKVDNAILAEEVHASLYPEMMNLPDVECFAGGATLNSIRIAQWMLSEDNKTSYFGCIGTDSYGEQLTKCAEADGVTVHYMKDTTTPTGTCAVCVKDTERSLVANLAAANNFKVEHLSDEKSMEIVAHGEVFYSAGFHLTVCPDAMVALGEHCVEHQKIFCLNLSAPFLMQFFKDPLERVLPYCDFVFANESEAAEFGKMKEWGSDLQQIALKLSALPKASGARPRSVVFTQGSSSVIVSSGGKVTTYDVPAVDVKEIVDSNGAGDAFVGGFLAQLSQGKDMDECVKAGTWAAQVILKQSGCSFPAKCEY